MYSKSHTKHCNTTPQMLQNVMQSNVCHIDLQCFHSSNHSLLLSSLSNWWCLPNLMNHGYVKVFMFEFQLANRVVILGAWKLSGRQAGCPIHYARYIPGRLVFKKLFYSKFIILSITNWHGKHVRRQPKGLQCTGYEHVKHKHVGRQLNSFFSPKTPQIAIYGWRSPNELSFYLFALSTVGSCPRLLGELMQKNL
jgi:hypothetical protein